MNGGSEGWKLQRLELQAPPHGLPRVQLPQPTPQNFPDVGRFYLLVFALLFKVINIMHPRNTAAVSPET